MNSVSRGAARYRAAENAGYQAERVQSWVGEASTSIWPGREGAAAGFDSSLAHVEVQESIEPAIRRNLGDGGLTL